MTDTALVTLTWDEFDEAVGVLGNAIREIMGGVPSALAGVYGEPRGGLCLAVAISHRLGLPLLDRLPFELQFVWVDDVLDTGQTFQRRLHQAPHMLPVFWVAKQEAPGGVLCAIDADPSEWIVFPWEDKTRAADERSIFLRSRGIP